MEDYILLANKILAMQPSVQPITQPRIYSRLQTRATDTPKNEVPCNRFFGGPSGLTDDQITAVARGLVGLEKSTGVQIPMELEASWEKAATAGDADTLEMLTMRIVGVLKGLDAPSVASVAMSVATHRATDATERNREKRAPW